MANAYFLHQIKHSKAGEWDKGIVIKASKTTSEENYNDALQGYHAYLGAYSYGRDPNTDFVSCEITDETVGRLLWETWDGRTVSAEA